MSNHIKCKMSKCQQVNGHKRKTCKKVKCKMRNVTNVKMYNGKCQKC